MDAYPQSDWVSGRNTVALEKNPPLRRYGASPRFHIGQIRIVIPPNTKCSVLLDNEVLTTAYPKLLVSGGKGASVEIKYAEALFDAKLAKGNRNDIDGRDFHPRRLTRDIFRFDGGNNREFSTLWYRTYRYVGLYFETKDEPLAVKDFTMFTAIPSPKRDISSRTTTIDKIWEVGWRTSRLCAHESYMDCPYYGAAAIYRRYAHSGSDFPLCFGRRQTYASGD